MKIEKIVIEFNGSATQTTTTITCGSGRVHVMDSLTKGQIKKLHRSTSRLCYARQNKSNQKLRLDFS